jgi:hypothetical protein
MTTKELTYITKEIAKAISLTAKDYYKSPEAQEALTELKSRLIIVFNDFTSFHPSDFIIKCQPDNKNTVNPVIVDKSL